MTYLHLFYAPGLAALVLLATLLSRYPRRPRPRTEAHQRALALLRSWLTPEQDEQWSARGDFDVIGSDTGTRYRITPRAIMNVQQLDEDGRPVARWCFAPEGYFATGDVLLAQKIALETMELKALAIANSQRLRV
jgi:hypothetical protein